MQTAYTVLGLRIPKNLAYHDPNDDGDSVPTVDFQAALVICPCALILPWDPQAPEEFVFVARRSNKAQTTNGLQLNSLDVSDIDAIRKNMMLIFEPVRLWDDKNFGVWTFVDQGC